MTRTIRFCLLLTCLSVTLVACGSQAAAPVHDPSAPARLIWYIAGATDVSTLDPALATDPDSLAVCSLLYRGLVRLDARLHVVPDGASHWTISPNGLRYTFFLRPHLRFADGAPVTAYDAAASLQRALGPDGNNGVVAAYLSDIARRHGHPEIAAVGPHVVRIRLRRPSAQFLAELAFPGTGIVDMAVVLRYGLTWTSHAEGFGPYRLASWIHGVRLVLRPNVFDSPRPNVRELIIRFSSPRDALQQFVRGAADVVSPLPADATLIHRFGNSLHVAPALALDYIVFNTGRHLLSSALMRRALTLVVNRDALAHAAYGAGAQPVASTVLPALLPGTPTETTDPALGRRLLDQIGHPLGRGIRPLRYLYPNIPGETSRALLLRAEFRRELDIKLVPVGLTSSAYVDSLDSHNFDLALVRWGVEYADPANFLVTQLGRFSAENLSGWSDRRFSRLIDLATASAFGSRDRRRLLIAAAAIATRAAVWIPLDSPLQAALVRSSVHGLHFTPAGLVGWDHLSTG